MKTTLALLIAGLFLLPAPLPVLAHGGGGWHADGPRHSKDWVKDRHAQRSDYRDQHRRTRQARKHVKKLVREQRREHQRPARHAYRPYYFAPPVIWGAPRILFWID